MRTAFLCLLSLVAGVAVGLILNFGFFDTSIQLSPATVSIAAVNDENTFSDEGGDENNIAAAMPTPSPDLSSNCILLSRAYTVLNALKDQDYAALSAMVHPQKGVTFTPYSTVDAQANLNFSAQDVARLANNTEKYIWGLTDGEGAPISMTMADYFATYVYNTDYTQAPVIGIDEIMASGNSLENVAEAYPEGRFVEFHFPGLQPTNQGFDWCSLKLVFEVYSGDYKLIAMIHSQWTI